MCLKLSYSLIAQSTPIPREKFYSFGSSTGSREPKRSVILLRFSTEDIPLLFCLFCRTFSPCLPPVLSVFMDSLLRGEYVRFWKFFEISTDNQDFRVLGCLLLEECFARFWLFFLGFAAFADSITLYLSSKLRLGFWDFNDFCDFFAEFSS